MSKNAEFKHGVNSTEEEIQIQNDDEEGENVLDSEHNFVRNLKSTT